MAWIEARLVVLQTPQWTCGGTYVKQLRELGLSGNHLMVFEVAARHQSFTVAAHELHVTQPAVSQSIAQLEAALGVRLFHRQRRAVYFTEAGEMLYEAVSDGFARVLKVVERLSRRSPGHVTLFTTAAFSYGWVLPRLRGFSALHPDIDLRIQVISRQLHYDPDDDSFLELRVGDGLWEGYESALLFPEEVFPVASPGYVDGMEHPHDPRALANERLIHEDVAFLPTIPAVAWSDWFAAFGIDYRDEGTGLRTSEYMLALQAAIGGEGVVLGWAHLVDRLLEQGLLVQVGDRRWRTERRLYLVWPSRVPLSPRAGLVKDWMVEAAADRRTGVATPC